ncbi:Crp/Fnr family transcriptional regulator [Puia sp. P3]|uniref:Crp/Fnr family transcriptional regulator n=1 Tax=Puia sp. P3 TaxID=3423952 RepID=UPI003D67B5E9
MYESLFAHIRKFVPLSKEEEEILHSTLRYKKVRKKEFLLKEKEVCTANHFVLKGCFRMYFTQENGVEQIIQFAIENWWITDFQSLDWQQPSHYYIQAVETSEIAILDRRVTAEVCDLIPKLDRYFRLIVQRAFAASQQNLLFIYTFSGEERYHHFNEAFPEFVQRVPQYMVASYLGFTPEFVSKIKSRRTGDGKPPIS